jgi:nucleoid-associated protein YejK
LLGKPLRGRTGLNTASHQQGLLQIVRDFCEHSDATCAGCQFPELVKQFVTMKEVCPPQPAAD